MDLEATVGMANVLDPEKNKLPFRNARQTKKQN
jgi:hypothetical protein